MKRVKRKCIWETNSSTTHSCIIMGEPQSKLWESENLYFYRGDSWWDPFKDVQENERPVRYCLYTEDEVLKFLGLLNEHYNPKEWEDNGGITQFIRECGCGFISYKMWQERELEEDVTTYTTPSGEKIIVYCQYGAEY